MIIAATTAALCGLAGTVGASPPDPAVTPGAAPDVGPDFDGDGYADLAVSAYGEDVDGVTYAGTVTVLYGSAGGVAPARSQKFDKTSDGIEGEPEPYKLFGSTLGSGDFDGDGFDDLVIGVPLDDGTTGSVHVLYGGPAGLSSETSQFLTLGRDGLPPDTSGDHLGDSVVGADFDGDGYDDLAMGAPDRTVGTTTLAGAVLVVPGSATGLVTSSVVTLDEQTLGSHPASNEQFGDALTAADGDGDGYPELVIGASSDLVRGEPSGAVYLVPGSAAGLVPEGARRISQDTEVCPVERGSSSSSGRTSRRAISTGTASTTLRWAPPTTPPGWTTRIGPTLCGCSPAVPAGCRQRAAAD